MSEPRTRMALLAGRARLALARQGQLLLERKRDALLAELYREVPGAFAASDELAAAADAARMSLDEARAWLGDEPVAAAGIATPHEVTIDLRRAVVMGLAVPAIEPRSRIHGLSEPVRAPLVSGPAVELVAQRFEQEVAIAVRLATIEARVRRLAREIRRTNSRVNALRTRIVPGLVAETRAIAFALEQRERDDRYRFKRVKARRASAPRILDPSQPAV